MILVKTDTETAETVDATTIDVRLSGILVCRRSDNSIAAAYSDGNWLDARIVPTEE
jgi:hypothetical protein